MKNTLNVKENVDISKKCISCGITSNNFIKDGHFFELMLLSSLRADGLSNLGYEYTEVFVLKMGCCSVNPVFGYIQISDELRSLFKLKTTLIKLKECNFKYGQLSVLFNLLYNIGIEALNIKAFGINFFTDISPSVSFTINRTPKYIRSLKDSIEKVLFTDEPVKLKSKDSEINNESQYIIKSKIDALSQMYSGYTLKDYCGNIDINVALGLDTGMTIFSSHDDCIHLETFVSVADKDKVYKNFGFIRVTVLNLGYSNLLNIDGIVGEEENLNLLFQMQDDMKAGLNLALGVIDAYTLLRNNRKSIF